MRDRGCPVKVGLRAFYRREGAALHADRCGAARRAGGLHPDRAAYWFLMQIGTILGFATPYPANWWLIKMGIKEAM